MTIDGNHSNKFFLSLSHPAAVTLPLSPPFPVVLSPLEQPQGRLGGACGIATRAAAPWPAAAPEAHRPQSTWAPTLSQHRTLTTSSTTGLLSETPDAPARALGVLTGPSVGYVYMGPPFREVIFPDHCLQLDSRNGRTSPGHTRSRPLAKILCRPGA